MVCMRAIGGSGWVWAGAALAAAGGKDLVLFGGDVLRAFSLALFIGVIFGTYSSIAVASPIMVWWEQRL